MRPRAFVLASILPISLALAPSVAQGQRVIYGCRAYDCTYADDMAREARQDAARARTEARQDANRARAEARRVAARAREDERADARAWSQSRSRERLRETMDRVRDRMAEREFQRRVHNWRRWD